MDLLNDKVINSNSFRLLQLVVKNSYIKDTHFKVSYDEFRGIVIAFTEIVMKLYLEDTKFFNEKYSCVVKKIPSYRRGEFDLQNNEITINESVIKEIYLGKINSMTVIFHELNHFKSKYDIKLGRVCNDIIRTIKEYLLRESGQDPFNEKNTIKVGISFINDDYYKCNYKVFSDEKLAEISSLNNLLSFVKMSGIELSQQDTKELEDRIRNNTSQYNNYLRDLRLNFNFNSYFLDFEEAFDVMIKFNPEWLAIPQLNIEYYLDKNGKVAKRTKEELEERLKTEKDEEIKAYIQYLLTPNKNKRLSKSEFTPDRKKFNIDKLNYYSKNNRKSKFK